MVFRQHVAVTPAVRRVDLEIYPGETLGLVGESGSGKSTLGRLLARLEPLDSGAIMFDGRDVGSLRGQALRQFRRRCQVVFQNPYASLNPRYSVRRILAVALRMRGVHAAREQVRLSIDLLQRVGLPASHLEAYPSAFSGGQRQRLALARALAAGFLILDEPTSALDVSIQAQVLDLLAELQAQSGMTYLFISHDIAVVEAVADRIAVMHRGEIVECGDSGAVVNAPRHPYTRSLVAAVPTIESLPLRRDPAGACP
jgi:ABC-type glutathione transport system ATPase component